jgi:hypothetical protein
MDKAYNPNGQKSFGKFLKLLLTAAGLQGVLFILGICLMLGSGILMLGCGILMMIFHHLPIYHLHYLHTLFFNGSCIGFAITLVVLLSIIIFPPKLKP